MPSYLITGASRGIGFAFLENLSSVPTNTVIGLVRNTSDTKAKISAWNRANVHLVQGDLNDYESLKAAVDATAKITGGGLDCLIANAAIVSSESEFEALGSLGRNPVKLENELIGMFRTNVVGNIHLFNLFMPLILKGDIKKVITLSSGMADLEAVRTFGFVEGGAYAISKAAMNMAVGKFSAEYSKDGVLFLSICPGVVETGHLSNLPEEKAKGAMGLVQKFQVYAPHFAGAAEPEDAVKDVLNVAEKASVENGDGGSYVSHFGNKQWI
ncbi:hypothetical protein BKA66DRAFT_132569 [Pyrenochaeta sp. MPI-SDFR-AT-0127]|nr:hypothetical protein BKA66DRAFT_132569 [Pyrenochaeta sp. MPI-SDFR-AT-0127]